MTPADQIYSLPTNTGAAKLSYALANNLTVDISHMAIGDGNGAVVNPTAAATKLTREVHRAQLNQLYQHPQNPNWLVAELVIPAEVGGWTIREIGLYDADGDLIFIGNHAEQYKPVQTQGSDETKTIRMVILVSSLATVTLRTDPTTVMATIKFVNDSVAAHAAAPDPHAQYAPRGKVTALSVSTALTKAAHEGLLLLDAAAGARTFTLPASNAALGVVEFVLRRTDTTANALVLAAAGTDKIMLDTTAEAAGQATTELLFAGDFLRLRSDGAGKWWCVGQAQLPGSIASGLTVYKTAGSHTYAVPAVLRSGRRRPMVQVVGGGGAGGKTSTAAVAPSGGAGGMASGLVDLAGVASVAVTVGAGGAAVTIAANGGNGAASSFGAYLSATGGTGNLTSNSGGAGGQGTGGTLNVNGGAGSPSTNSSTERGGSGGDSALAPGGVCSLGTFDAAQHSGQWPGGGGGGVSSAASQSGPGALGAVLITWG
ncbi:hypothetical protein 3S19_1 [uncultured Caudovirales phage]|uniref:Phage tail-collar fibre protein n=1 Tax=uncultured Caudovirales phage TaxID=2100421 RepID=A0A2H4JEU4_9CAUD|nr:hypothetical protein 3S19_1 [uncultured Caudovirales phage]